MDRRIAYSALILSFALIGVPGCGPGERAVRFENYAIYERPAQLPDAFPRSFRPPQATLLRVAIHNREPYRSAAEGMAEFETELSMEAALQHYQDAFQKAGWQIIQSNLDESETLLIAESPSRRLASLILRKKEKLHGVLFIRQAALL